MPSNNPMVSETSICNQALQWLGQDPITSLNDNNTTAEWMRNNYPFLRDAVLEERMWTFATVRIKSETADMDAWGVQYSHAIPANWISVFRCYENVNAYGGGTIDKTFRVEGQNVLSSCSTVYLWGIQHVEDTGQFSPLFVQALAARLAADAAIPFTENRELQRDMWGLYGDKLREAAARDGQQGGNDTITQHRLTGARSAGGYGFG